MNWFFSFHFSSFSPFFFSTSIFLLLLILFTLSLFFDSTVSLIYNEFSDKRSRLPFFISGKVVKVLAVKGAGKTRVKGQEDSDTENVQFAKEQNRRFVKCCWWSFIFFFHHVSHLTKRVGTIRVERHEMYFTLHQFEWMKKIFSQDFGWRHSFTRSFSLTICSKGSSTTGFQIL